MKKLVTLSLIMLTLVCTNNLSAQKFSGLDKSPMDMAYFPSSYKVTDKAIRVIYSRPQLKGRSVSELAPAGEVWRTGANEAVEITFYKDANIGGTDIKAGTYSLFTIPGKKEWTIILNSNLNQWGAYSYSKKGDIARVKAATSTGSDSLDAFSIAFKEIEGGTHLVMGWGTVRVTLPIML
ncbi:MAG: asparagine synthetase B [Maribacter sp.]|nr:MAG: asparagine synthetase B [Maribacter sp.]